MTLIEVASQLYGLSMGEFTPARDARAKALKGTPDAALVKALRKPTLAAWVVNQLVRHETEQVDQVLAVGAALREAAASLDGDELRALTKQRRQLTMAVTTQARRVALELGVKVTPAVADQIEATLTAAMLDPQCAQALRSGLLITHLASTGVSDGVAAAAVAFPEALGFATPPAVAEPPMLHVVPDPDADEKALRAAEADFEAAVASAEAAWAELESSEATVSELEARSMQLQSEIDEHKRELAQLEGDYEELEEELSEAEDARADLAAASRAAEAERLKAEQRLAKLTT